MMSQCDVMTPSHPLRPLLLQFAVLMWILTYVGALFNGLTLLILGEPPLLASPSGSTWWSHEKQ